MARGFHSDDPEREQAVLARQRAMLAILFPFIVLGIAAVVFVLMNARRGGPMPDPPGDAAKRTAQPDKPQASAPPRPTLHMLETRQQAMSDLRELEEMGRGATIGLHIDNARDLFAQAEAANESGDYDAAAKLFEQAAAVIDEVRRMDGLHRAALAAKDAASSAITNAAASPNPPPDDVLRRARGAIEEADVYFSEGLLEKAAARYAGAQDELVRYAARLAGRKRVAAAQEAFGEAMSNGPGEAVVRAAGGAQWSAIRDRLDAAAAARDDGRFDDAVRELQHAAAALPDLFDRVELRLLRYRIYLAGYQSAEAVTRHSDGEAFDARIAERLGEAFEQIGLPATLARQVRGGQRADTAELGRWLLTGVRDALASRHGEPARHTFTVGVNMFILGRLLADAADEGGEQTLEIINTRLGALIETCEQAEFSATMTDALANVRDQLGETDPGNAPDAFVALTRRLDQINTAAPYIDRSAGPGG